MCGLGTLRRHWTHLLYQTKDTVVKAITLEVRAGEGGSDARRFCAELALAYVRVANREG